MPPDPPQDEQHGRSPGQPCRQHPEVIVTGSAYTNAPEHSPDQVLTQEPGSGAETPPNAVPVATPADADTTASQPPHANATHPAAIEEDGEGIYCPICNYNLTGAMSGRCPECGALFSRQSLIAAQRANRVTLIPWDNPQAMPFRERLWSTLRICLIKPDRFAFAFSVQPQQSRAGRFMALMMLMTIVGSVPMTAISLSLGSSTRVWDTNEAGLATLAIAAFVILLVAGTALCAGLLLGAMCPHYDGKRHLRPWLAVCAYASGHYLMLPVLLPFTFFAPQLVAEGVWIIGFCVCLGCSVLCCLTLIAVVKHRTAEHLRGPSVGLLLAAIYVIGTGLAAIAAGVLVEILDNLLWRF